jgi:hypothetical protein
MHDKYYLLNKYTLKLYAYLNNPATPKYFVTPLLEDFEE